eukprot:m.333839 g.333839  ORF g.333839 m.333839 type:complete len:82 (+) comp16523_c0_seq7:2599-2844(+)
MKKWAATERQFPVLKRFLFSELLKHGSLRHVASRTWMFTRRILTACAFTSVEAHSQWMHRESSTSTGVPWVATAQWQGVES